MNKFTILIRIAVIIFVVEGIIMMGLSLIAPIANPMVESLIDAVLLTLLSSPVLYLWVVKPYAEERLNLVLEVERLLSGLGGEDSQGD